MKIAYYYCTANILLMPLKYDRQCYKNLFLMTKIQKVKPLF